MPKNGSKKQSDDWTSRFHKGLVNTTTQIEKLNLDKELGLTKMKPTSTPSKMGKKKK